MRFDAAVVWCDDSASVTPGRFCFLVAALRAHFEVVIFGGAALVSDL